MNYQLLTGDNRAVLRTLPAKSVHCVTTSPPYAGLRDYGVDGQIGLESIPDCLAWARKEPPCGECYVCALRAVFSDVWRVLRDDGVLWLNLGDSYNGSGGAGGDYGPGGIKEGQPRYPGRKVAGLKPKDLMMIPARVAMALQSDGRYLRQDVIWAKAESGDDREGNAMPNSATDRCQTAHEYVFLLTKRPHYFFDGEAIKEPTRQWTGKAATFARSGKVSAHVLPGQSAAIHRNDRTDTVDGKKGLRRSVWRINPKPFSAKSLGFDDIDHFATMPPELAETCIKAGSSEAGCCANCGAPLARVVEKGLTAHDGDTKSAYATGTTANRLALLRQAARERGEEYSSTKKTLGWQPVCDCNVAVIPCTVLDPFNGSGTTGAVACSLGRDYIGIDLNSDYIEMAHARIRDAINSSGRAPVVRVGKAADYASMPLFAEVSA